MPGDKSPCSVLVVSSGEKGASFITNLLDPAYYFPVIRAGSAAKAKQILISMDFDIVIINSPLSDEAGHEFAMALAAKKISEILLIVKSENYEEISYLVDEFGIFTLFKPLSPQSFYQSLKFVNTARTKIKQLEHENIKLHLKMEELRIVNRAKCVVIAQLHMTEEQAHRYIEKQAMDMRTSKRIVAENILRTFGNDTQTVPTEENPDS